MNEQAIKEKKYLMKVFSDKLPDDNPFIMRVSKDKEMFIISPGESIFGTEINKISQFRDIYNTVLDLRNKIRYSLENAIEYAYSEDVRKNYNILHSSGNNEWLAYYFIENAMFRVETMWDILAHVYNIKYDLGEPIHKVYHSRIFSNQDKYKNEYWNGNPPQNVQKIVDYINENDDTNGKIWKGNYSFINTLRNNMTHKFSISQSNMSNFAFEMKYPPAYILKRLCESFATLQEFLYEIFDSILEEIENEYTECCPL